MTQPLVLVTGATDGIGRETARELTRRGATVLVHGRDRERLRATAAELAELAGRPAPEPVAADLASLDAVRRMAAEIDERGHRLDVVIHNAGAGLRRVVNVSSIAHSRGRVDLGDPQLLRQPFSSYASYATSKLVRGRQSPAHPLASDPALVHRFYELSAALTGAEPLPEN